jgi:hypothetical protein
MPCQDNMDEMQDYSARVKHGVCYSMKYSVSVCVYVLLLRDILVVVCLTVAT